MYLKSLTISSEDGVIREIYFRNGMNLIVDETPIYDGKETGNNVGKTAVLLLIDFCLGGSQKNLYTDPENSKHEYSLVKNFLVEKKVTVTLILKENLSCSESAEVEIQRQFKPNNRATRMINGQKQTEEEFDEFLTNLLFPGHYGKKPTFPQIISHNIRCKEQRLSNTLQTLNSYTTDVEYETLYLFLLGCNFEQGERKQRLVEQIRSENHFKKRLEKEQTKSAYESLLAMLNLEIKELEKEKLSFQVNETFKDDLEAINSNKYKMNFLSSQISRLKLRRKLIIENKEELMSGKTNADLFQLHQVYQHAKNNIEKLQQTFDELTAFHNSMIDKKVEYLNKELPELDDSIKTKEAELDILLSQEKELATRVFKSDSFEKLENVIKELNEKYQKKGEYESIIQQINEVESKISSLNEELALIENELFSDESERLVKEQVNKFNVFFSFVSNFLYGEKYALKADPIVNRKNQKIYKFNVFHADIGNVSSGKKQGEITCFDIAYTLFADDENISCFHFLLNDKRELMHDNQLVGISKIVEKEGIQFVASILKDKLPEELNDESYFISKLSQDDKLFRIEKYKSTPDSTKLK